MLLLKRILERALEYGIPRENVIIDCLTLTASAQQKEVVETLKAVRMVKEQLGLKTALGVSNISFRTAPSSDHQQDVFNDGDGMRSGSAYHKP